MYSYDWIVLVTMGLDRCEQTRQTPAHRQATHEIEFEAAELRHRDRLRVKKRAKIRRGTRRTEWGLGYPIFEFSDPKV